MGREEEIREIAYCLWEQDGCCHGHDMEHWVRAEIIWKEKQKTSDQAMKQQQPVEKTAEPTRLDARKKQARKR